MQTKEYMFKILGQKMICKTSLRVLDLLREEEDCYDALYLAPLVEVNNHALKMQVNMYWLDLR